MKASSGSGLCASVSVLDTVPLSSSLVLWVGQAFLPVQTDKNVCPTKANLVSRFDHHQVVPVAGGDFPAALLVFRVGFPVGKEPPLDRFLVGAVAEGGEVAPDQHDLEVPLRRALVEHRAVHRNRDEA